jgi:hypothetical protein
MNAGARRRAVIPFPFLVPMRPGPFAERDLKLGHQVVQATDRGVSRDAARAGIELPQ